MATSSWKGFMKAVLIPMLIALSIYVIVFLVVLPLYRRYRSRIARYAAYTPLSSSLARQTTSIFEPYLIEPGKTFLQKVREVVGRVLVRVLVPGAWTERRGDDRALGVGLERGRGGGRGHDTGGDDFSDEEIDAELYSGLFDAESGEVMVGFDGREGSRVVGARRLIGERAGGHGMGVGGEDVVDDSNRRLSRELEQGFRDDSESEASDEEVTVGRRTLSRRGSEVRR